MFNAQLGSCLGMSQGPVESGRSYMIGNDDTKAMVLHFANDPT